MRNAGSSSRPSRNAWIGAQLGLAPDHRLGSTSAAVAPRVPRIMEG